MSESVTSKKKPRVGAPPRNKRSPQQKLYGEEGPEVKYFDVASTFNASVIATVTDMSTMAQGLTNITRIANKVHVISAAIRISSFPVVNATAVNANTCKWSIVLDKEPEASAIASYNQVYTGNAVQAMGNINYSDRFVILATGTWSHGARNLTATQSYSDGGDMSKYVDEWRKVDINTKYLLTTATQTAVGSNQLLLCVVNENDDTNELIQIQTRIRFTDE